MITIRNQIFDTNSSTSHTLIVTLQETYDRWKASNLYLYYPSGSWDPFYKIPESERPVKGTLYEENEVLEFLKKIGYVYNSEEYESVPEFIKELYLYFISSEDWFEDEYLEIDKNTYTTPGGENIVITCKYGRNG